MQGWKARSRTGTVRRRIAALVAPLAVLAFPGAASAAVINFDELSAPSPGGGRGTIVNVQYASQGVTFNDIEVYNNPAVARSQPNVAETPCFAVELCQGPIVARFTTGQDRVRVFAGYSFNGPPPSVRITAFDAENGGNQIDSVEVQLPGGSGPVRANTELALNPPGSQIRRIEITTGSSFTTSLAIDDFEFSDVGAPPACTASGPPVVNLFRPAKGDLFNNNLFQMTGAASPNGASITSARIERLEPNPRSTTIYPGLIDSDGGNFNVMVGSLLAPGENDIQVTATNCAGTGASGPIRIIHEPIPSTARFNLLSPIEVNQAIQDPTNQVRLIAADGTNFKRTFARVYLGLQGATTIEDVSGTLTAFRPDGSRPDGPVLVESLNAARVGSANTLENVRANNLNASINFELPREWLEEGRLHLELTNLKVEDQSLQIPCDGCVNPNASGLPDIIRFHRVPPVRVWLIRVPYQPTPGGTTFTPTQNDLDMLASWLRRAYPTAEVRNTNMFLGETLDDDPEVRDNAGKVVQEGFTCSDVNQELRDLVSSQQSQHAATRYYGIVDDGGGFMRGCAPIGGHFGSGPAGTPGGWDTDTTYADWYGGHELGHTFDRKHPGQCTETANDDSFPYDPDGLIGEAANDYQGIDAGNTTLGLPMQLYDWRDRWADVMTYCDNQWISDYTYRGILKDLCDEDRPNCPDRKEITRTTLRAEGKKKRPALTVNGELNLANDRLDLGTLATGRGLTLTDRPKRSAYEIVLRGPGRDKVYPFEPKEIADLPEGQERAEVHEVVPFDPRARKIVIEQSGRVLETVKVTRNAPSLKLGKVKKKGDEVKVRWRSRDRDGGRPTHSVLYSPDGKEYLPVATGLRGRSHTVELDQLPGGKKARIRVVANDGVLTGSSTSKTFKVPAKAPNVSILSPEPAAAGDADDQVQLVADVQDLQDQQFAENDIVWRSDRQGELGTGPSIVTRLDAGSHEITVTATNSGRKQGSASIRLEVDEVPPVFNAG